PAPPPPAPPATTPRAGRRNSWWPAARRRSWRCQGSADGYAFVRAGLARPRRAQRGHWRDVGGLRPPGPGQPGPYECFTTVPCFRTSRWAHDISPEHPVHVPARTLGLAPVEADTEQPEAAAARVLDAVVVAQGRIGRVGRELAHGNVVARKRGEQPRHR